MATYKVTEPIRDSQDNEFFYDTGDTFPRIGFEVSQERLDKLVEGGFLVAEQELNDLKKDELIKLAEDKGIDVDSKDTKADIIEKLGE